MRHKTPSPTIPVAAVLVAVAAGSPLLAQGTAPSKPPVQLTEAEKKEKAARHACKVEICSAFRNKRAAGADITCPILKTWRTEDLQEVMAKGKLSWPWGPARCTSDIRLPRQMLIAAVTQPKYEADIGAHKVSCEVDRAKEGDKYTLAFEIKPRVTFENGKATKAKLGWGKVEGSSAAKGALWTATSVDNTFNVLQGSVVEQINAFLGPKCDEVKDELAAK
jgi:hypothetical protein